LNTTEDVYRRPLAEWHFSVWLDVDDRPHVDWSVTPWDPEYDRWEGAHAGHLESAILAAYRAQGIEWDPTWTWAGEEDE